MVLFLPTMPESGPLNVEEPRRSAEDFLSLIKRQSQGKLKIYLGAAPGVGKTFQMLIEGNRLRRRGVDVVIGYVEPHDRPETTAQIADLEIIPPVVTQYKGLELKEMDTAAILLRAPTVALVDELAHSNAPGTRNRKRYEDVEALMGAGINVIGTLNIQHLESLYNVVELATGVRVKERIPDEFLKRADQIVNIDLPAEDLIERLEAGKIYPKDRVGRAMTSFFTPGNLTRLREMALSESAIFLDRQQRVEASAPEKSAPVGLAQVMVALSSGGPDPGAILRKTARLAANLNAPWFAVYVRTPAESPQTITAGAQRVIDETLETAQRMGGVVIVLKNEKVAPALLAFAREYGITHLVIGRPGSRGILGRLRSTLHDELMRNLHNVDLVVV
jgi:two-component system sensor histidine kinase KdpD